MSSAQEKRQLILDTASRLFSRFGYSKTSLDEIASAAQIAKGTVYYYFPSKEELFMAAVEEKSVEYFGILAKQISEIAGFENQLLELMHVPIRFIYENMPILIEGIHNLPYSYHQRLEEFRQLNKARMKQMLLEILALGHSEGVLNADLSDERFCEVILDWFLLGDANFIIVDMQKLIDRIERNHELILDILLHGILKRG